MSSLRSDVVTNAWVPPTHQSLPDPVSACVSVGASRCPPHSQVGRGTRVLLRALPSVPFPHLLVIC